MHHEDTQTYRETRWTGYRKRVPVAGCCISRFPDLNHNKPVSPTTSGEVTSTLPVPVPVAVINSNTQPGLSFKEYRRARQLRASFARLHGKCYR